MREEESPHTWADDWVYDETVHWRECTVCNERNYNEEEVHDWVDGVCDTCGYTCGHSGYTVGTCSRCGKYLGEHTHSFNWRWSVDEKVHWHQCFYCKETLSYGEHDWSDEDGVCAVCGYQCSHGYQYSGICDICGADCAELHEYFWWTSRTEHCWNCVDCGDSGYWEDHSWNENGVCSVCDYQCGHNGMTSGICEICETIVTGHIHSGGGNGSYWRGGNTHWYRCEDCGESFAEEPHSWKDGYCSICNYQCEHNYEYSGTCEKCGMNLDEIEHDPVLRYDDEDHWYWCADCSLQISEYENHQYDTETGACTVCGYQCGHGGQEEGECLTCGKTLDGHDHSVKNTEDADWVYDGSGHWLQCSCGEKLFFEKHVRQENNWGCLICDYTCDDTLNEEWSFDASGHWKECLCGLKSIFRAHDWSEGDGICAECGYQPGECDHFGLKAGTCAGCGEYLGDAYEHVAPDSSGWGNYSYDDEEHWTYCVNCGEKMDAAPHEWKEGNDSSYHWRICSVCDAEGYYGEHTWENGVCMECGYACTHEGEDGNCTCRICGKLINEDDHMFIHKSNRVEHWEECLDCGYRTNIELHTWGTGDKEGICTVCNRYCRHDGATSGTCELCGKFLGCEIHDFSPEYESSYFGHWHVCKNCDAVDGEPVSHDWSNKDGICAVCGYVCNSEHELGVCQECGLYLGEHIHEFYTWYEYDESRHGKQCRLCTEVWDVNLHDWSAGDGMCTICHYMCEHGEQYSGICEICHEDLGEDHEHDYKWGFDDYEGESGKPNSHWQFCAICRQRKNTGTHNWSNKDGVCTVCGFPCNHDGEESGICWICGAEIAGHGHSFDRMIGRFDYSTDEYNHWYQCVECGEHFYEEPHVWDPEHGYCALCYQHCQHNIDSEGICTICGMNMNDEKHSYIQRYDRYKHWLECETCENKWKYEAHDWNEGVCEVCGFQCGHNGRQNGECWDCGKILTGQHDHEVTFDGFEAYE